MPGSILLHEEILSQKDIIIWAEARIPLEFHQRTSRSHVPAWPPLMVRRLPSNLGTIVNVYYILCSYNSKLHKSNQYSPDQQPQSLTHSPQGSPLSSRRNPQYVPKTAQQGTMGHWPTIQCWRAAKGRPGPGGAKGEADNYILTYLRCSHRQPLH